jgi:hypothetical protein
MLLGLFDYTVENYDESLILLDSLKKTVKSINKRIAGLVL